MWALHRASNPIWNRASSIGISRLYCAMSETASSCLDERAMISEHSCAVFDSCLPLKIHYHSTSIVSNCSMWKHTFSSQAGARSSGEEDDLEDGFSELEMLASADVTQEINAETENEDDLISEPEFTGVDEDSEKSEEPSQVELGLSDTKVDVSEKKLNRKGASSELFKTLVAAPVQSIDTVLNEVGYNSSWQEIAMTMHSLRKHRMYGKALQFSEWLEKKKKIHFDERNYASRVDLIAKLHGLIQAENYIKTIPKFFKGERVYRTLLANCVAANNSKKAEEIFNKMKNLEFPITCFACNQLLLLYKRVDKKKIAGMLSLMEKENVKPTLLTYKLLIDTKGRLNDLIGMDQIYKTMKAECIEPDRDIQSILARHYIYGGLKEKGEAILKEIEGDNVNKNCGACGALLPLYATLGKADEVRRLWKVCQPNPQPDECIAVIEAWGMLKNIEEAEAVFDMMLKTWKKLSSKHYHALLRVYADQKMLAKGKELVKQMGASGCKLSASTWDALVKLYVEAGEVEKADSILHKATVQNQIRPMFSSYMAILAQYAKRGDIHNSEKIFFRMRQSGYVSRIQQFDTLIQAYVNAKAPFYGIRERLKADNIYPNKAMGEQLALVDAFRKNAVSDLLE